jgi:peptidoglycan/xylan/chitin deacetylase (PgdA/CDA1 family)
MYHFVRELEGSAYPRLKALPTKAFDEQLGYLQAHYRLVSMEDCFEAVLGLRELPTAAALLTFDDAYVEHYATVFPKLRARGIAGAFFPPARAIERSEVLDVNKIHFVLARVESPRALITELFALLDQHREIWSLESNRDYWQRLAKPFNYDDQEAIFIKRLLQRELPAALRKEIVDSLFRKYVTADEATFSRELYLNREQLAEMVRGGMYVGSHGYDHYWLDRLSPDEQQNEIDRSLEFLRGVGIATDRWAIAYPFGAYNESLLEIARARGAVLGFTSVNAIAELKKGRPLELPRLDTNEFPRDARASANIWTLQSA